jgi:hypothetical protein
MVQLLQDLKLALEQLLVVLLILAFGLLVFKELTRLYS